MRLGIYNVAGREVVVIRDGVQTEGPHEVSWNGKDDSGRELGAGMYFVRLEAAGETRTSKMMLLR